MRPFLMILSLALTLFSCKNDPSTEVAPDKVIQIDLDHLSSDDLPALKIRSLIPLETSDSSIIGSVSSLELHDGRIYILDMFKTRALMAFSDSGDFIGKTKYGKGPGEMINPFSLYLDKGSHSVYVWDQGLLSILHYNSDLDFQDQKAYFLNGSFEKNLLPKCSVRGITSDDVFYATVNPEDLDDFQQATGGQLVDGEVNLDGNPYVMTFTLDQGR